MEGGLLEPLTVGMHGTELSDAKLGETAIVLGCGCIGLCTIMSLKAQRRNRNLCSRRTGQTSGKSTGSRCNKSISTAQKESIEEFAKNTSGRWS